jgi:hypothetical protein
MDDTAFGHYQASAIPDEDEPTVESVSSPKPKDMRRTKSVGSISPEASIMLPMNLPFQHMTGQFPSSFFHNMMFTQQDMISVMAPNIPHDMTVPFMNPMIRQPRRGRGGRVNDSRDR